MVSVGEGSGGDDVRLLVRSLAGSFRRLNVWSDYSSDDLFSFRSSSKGFVRFDYMTDWMEESRAREGRRREGQT